MSRFFPVAGIVKYTFRFPANGTSKGPVSRGGIAITSLSEPRAASAEGAVVVEAEVAVGVEAEVEAEGEGEADAEVEVGVEVGPQATVRNAAAKSAFMHYPSEADAKV
jgi:hypothetical protein